MERGAGEMRLRKREEQRMKDEIEHEESSAEGKIKNEQQER